MNESLKQLQQKYIETLRSVSPAIIAWWDEHCPYRWTEPVPQEAMTDFHRRWLVGPAAHPRIIAVFREYFLAIDQLNDRIAAEEKEKAASIDHETVVWGKDVQPQPLARVLPIDLLVNDLAIAAPDLFEIMQGLVFIPIAMDPDGEVC